MPLQQGSAFVEVTRATQWSCRIGRPAKKNDLFSVIISGLASVTLHLRPYAALAIAADAQVRFVRIAGCGSNHGERPESAFSQNRAGNSALWSCLLGFGGAPPPSRNGSKRSQDMALISKLQQGSQNLGQLNSFLETCRNATSEGPFFGR